MGVNSCIRNIKMEDKEDKAHAIPTEDIFDLKRYDISVENLVVKDYIK